MSGLSTHVLDTSNGCPAVDVHVTLWRDHALLFDGRTNADGRCPGLVDGQPLEAGRYRLEFEIADYFRGKGLELPDPPFLDRVCVDFGIADPTKHHHVPLLVSPYGYSTYRGS